jgi:uncharacterized protein (TIGR02145 family)
MDLSFSVLYNRSLLNKKPSAMKKSFMFWFLPLCMLLMMVGCDKCVVPTVKTTSESSVTQTSAMSGGEVTSDGGSAVTERGVCWNTSTIPTTANSKTSDGTGMGSFTSSLTSLTAATKYYVRAYATNSEGTGYGNEITFTTAANLSSITTSAVSAITSSTATCGGNITADGGGAVTARGVCWSTTTNPTISNSKTTDGTGIGSFVSSLTALTPGTKYYVRAYSTNSAGTSYGNEVSFTALAMLPTVTTTAIAAITATSASSGGNVTADGGGNITARGVCWSTTTGPTISNSKTSDGVGTGIFTSSLSQLTANTTYYVKAYATNSTGTSYGAEISFKTSANPPTVTTTAASSVTNTTASSGGNVTSDGGSTITARGVCWGTSSGPTITGNKTTETGTTGIFTSSLTSLNAGTTYYVRAYATNSSGTTYGNEISFTTSSTTGIIFNPNLTYGSLTDIDNNVYRTIQIGTQVWMAENLRTTKYKNGSAIPNVTDNMTWRDLTTPAFCYYNNDAATNKYVYGALYNWFTVNTGNLCPTGWHVPADTEWATLVSYLGGTSVAGAKLKETTKNHWLNFTEYATNESGFTALPAGMRAADHGTVLTWWLGVFGDLGSYGNWWSRTELTTINSSYWYTYGNTPGFLKGVDLIEKQNGLSVRCLKD